MSWHSSESEAFGGLHGYSLLGVAHGGKGALLVTTCTLVGLLHNIERVSFSLLLVLKVSR